MTQHLALIARTTSLIAAGDIVGAESALAELADTEGDGALVEVLALLEPKDVLAVVREYDDSKPSVVGLLVSPEQFARALVRTGHFDTFEDDGAMLSDDALLASLYVRPHIDLDEVADRDWMQLAWLLRYECRDLFIEMLLVLRAKARAHDQGLVDGEESEEDDGVIETSDTDRGRATPAARTSDEESAI